MNDDDFYKAFYAKSDIPRQIPVRLREMLQDAIGMDFGGLRPDDDLVVASDELDWADVFYLMQREFSVSIPKEAWSEFDRTFDSLVTMVASRMMKKSAPTQGKLPACHERLPFNQTVSSAVPVRCSGPAAANRQEMRGSRCFSEGSARAMASWQLALIVFFACRLVALQQGLDIHVCPSDCCCAATTSGAQVWFD